MDESILKTALMFDGINDYIEIPHHEAFNSATFTLEAWIKPTGQGTRTLTSKGDGRFNPHWGFIGYTHHILQLQHRDEQNVLALYLARTWCYAEIPVPNEQWTHVAVSTNRYGEVFFYLNGQAAGQQKLDYLTPSVNHAFLIGLQGSAAASYPFSGQISELRFWRCFRDQATIQATLDQPLVGNENDLIGYWRIQGAQAIDQSLLGHHGIVHGQQGEQLHLSADEIRSLLSAQIGAKMAAGVRIFIAENHYYCPPLMTVRQLLSKSTVDQFEWAQERFDCDDFSILLKADFALAAYQDGQRQAPYCLGLIAGLLPERHAINWFIDDTKTFYFVEPQEDKIFLPPNHFREIDFILL